MDTDTADTRFAAIDYAVAQKILPSINGVGDRYKTLIKDLLNECESMPLCKKHLKRIEQTAEETMGYYQFFSN